MKVRLSKSDDAVVGEVQAQCRQYGKVMRVLLERDHAGRRIAQVFASSETGAADIADKLGGVRIHLSVRIPLEPAIDD